MSTAVATEPRPRANCEGSDAASRLSRGSWYGITRRACCPAERSSFRNQRINREGVSAPKVHSPRMGTLSRKGAPRGLRVAATRETFASVGL